MHFAPTLARRAAPLRFTFFTLLAGFALTGCKQPAPQSTNGNSLAGAATTAASTPKNAAPPYTGNDITLGQFGSLTGATATFGISTDNGVKMAIDEANKNGGALNKKIRVVTVDDGSKTDQAASAVQRLINREKVLAILGEVASSNSLAAAPICQSAGVPMLSPASTNPTVTRVGDYIFRSCFTDVFQGAALAKFARENLKAKKVAILTDVASDYSKGLTKYFLEEWKRGGGEVVEASYSGGDKDFRGQLTTIKSANPDVILVTGYYTEVGNLAVQARSLGLKQPLLGGDGWDSEKLFEISKGALEGSYYSNHYSAQDKSSRVANFVAAYKKRFGSTPDVMAALGYDATRIMIDAIKRAGDTDRAKIRDALAATKDFEGVTGNISFDENRDAKKDISILQVKGNEADYVTTVKP